MQRRLVALFAAVLLVAGCGGEPATDTPEPTQAAAVVEMPSAEPSATATVQPTAAATPVPPSPTAAPTETSAPAPSEMPMAAPTETPSPTPSPTLVPLSGEAELEGNRGVAFSLAWSPDGRVLAAAGHLQVKLWDAASGESLDTLEGHRGQVWGVAWSPDGSTLASTSTDGTVRLWDGETWEELNVFDIRSPMSLAWSPDGSQLAAGSMAGNVGVWDVEGGVLLHDLKRPLRASDIIAVAWSPDGTRIASGQWDGAIVVWDARSGGQVQALEDYTNVRCDVNGLAWSPDGEVLASAHQDGKVRLWDTEDWELLNTLERHAGWVRGVAWSPDGRLLASSGQDRSVRVWDVETGQLRAREVAGNLPLWSVVWSPDGIQLAAGNGEYQQVQPSSVWMWTVPTGMTSTANPQPAAAEVPVEEVWLTTDDGVGIAATLFGDGETAVIYLHMGAGNATQKSWHPFARLTAETGFAALTVDFRGCGESEGRLAQDGLILDARAAIEFLRERGFSRFACVGASMGGTTCIRLAQEVDLAGLGVISSATFSGTYRVGAQDLALPAVPKLFVYGDRDMMVPDLMAEMYRIAAEPKQEVVYDSAAHGTDLFRSPYGEDLSQVLLEFLEDVGAAASIDSAAPSDVAGPGDAGPLAFLDGGGVLALSSGPIAGNALEIQLMDADSGEQDSAGMLPLTDNGSDDISPAWSPDGERIAFLSASDGSFDIYVLHVQAALQGTGEPLRLTNTSADEYDPSWSPDGTQIAFSSGRGGGWGIYVMDVPGGGEAGGGGQASPAPRKLTGEASRQATLDWSPDGTQIVFDSSRDGNRELYVMAVPGARDAAAGDGEPPELLRLTDNDVTDFAPDWSPDGTQIAYTSLHGGNYDIYVMEADGSDPRRLTTRQADDWWPDWSPDGRQIAFSSFDHSRNQERYYHEIYVMNANGRGLRRLTTSTADDWYAAWRPGPAAEARPPAGASLGDTWTRPADNMAMVYVPGGSFEMGSAASQVEAALRLCEEYPDTWGKCEMERFQVESPQHLVTLDGFWLDRTEVTNAQYNLCVEAGACRPSRLAGDGAYNGADHPVAGIPWQDAAAYCAWAGGRLPTEAEWEYAARGGGGRVYPWGDEFDCAGGNFGDEITGCDDGYAESAPVGSFPAGTSWCGALDMAGNAWEWVADAYGAYPAEDQTNPTGPAEGEERVLRGGSWAYYPPFLRTAHRYPVPPTADYLAVGFRCAVQH